MTEELILDTSYLGATGNVHVTFRPLLTYTRRAFAYEVLSERSWGDSAAEMNWSHESSDASNTFRKDFRAQAGASLAMVTVCVTKSLEECLRDLPPGCILLLQRSSALDLPPDRLVEHCKALIQHGIQVGIAEYGFESYWSPIISLLSFIRVTDSRNLNPSQKAFLLGPHRRQIRFIAQGIENEADLQWAMTAGYQLFQGSFFRTPPRRKLPEAWFKERVLLLQRACEYPCDQSKFIQDLMDYPDIIARLRHALNAFSSEEVHSQEAIEKLSSWLGDALFSRLAQYVLVQELWGQTCRDLMIHCFRQARFFYLAARNVGLDPREVYLNGLLDSCLPNTAATVVGKPGQEPISIYIRRTLGLAAPCAMHQLLECLVEGYDRGDWASVRELCLQGSIDPNLAADFYRSASRWACDLVDLRESEETSSSSC